MSDKGVSAQGFDEAGVGDDMMKTCMVRLMCTSQMLKCFLDEGKGDVYIRCRDHNAKGRGGVIVTPLPL